MQTVLVFVGLTIMLCLYCLYKYGLCCLSLMQPVVLLPLSQRGKKSEHAGQLSQQSRLSLQHEHRLRVEQR